MSESTFREKLWRDFHAPVPFSMPYAQLANAAGLFLTFLTELPHEVRQSLQYPSPYGENATPDGLTDKRWTNGEDHKVYFHWCRRITREENYWSASDAYPAACRFFAAAENIYREAEQVAFNVFRQEFPEFLDLIFVDGKMPNASLRFLCYAPNGTDGCWAKGHRDKSFATLALAESCPGLRIGCCPNHDLAEVVHQPKTALFMPGKLMRQMSEGGLPDAWHDVVPVEGTAPVDASCDRWAIVLFIDHIEGEYPSYDEAHSDECPRLSVAA